MIIDILPLGRIPGVSTSHYNIPTCLFRCQSFCFPYISSFIESLSHLKFTYWMNPKHTTQQIVIIHICKLYFFTIFMIFNLIIRASVVLFIILYFKHWLAQAMHFAALHTAVLNILNVKLINMSMIASTINYIVH